MIDARWFQDWGICGKDICDLDKSFEPTGHLIRYDPSTNSKQIRPVDVGPRIDINTGIDISPDGHWLIYTRADSLESDIMMVENFR